MSFHCLYICSSIICAGSDRGPAQLFHISDTCLLHGWGKR